METIHIWIAKYGYAGIFTLLLLGIVGIPIPDETLLAFSGYLIFKGNLHLLPTFLSAFLGSIIGITISYTIGRTVGLYLIHKYGVYLHITETRLQKAHNWFEKSGRWSLLLGYFIPGVRHVVAIIAGTSELELWEFIVFAYMGAILWTSTFISIGYFFGDKWESILSVFLNHLIIVLLILFIATAIFFFIRKRKKALPSSADK